MVSRLIMIDLNERTWDILTDQVVHSSLISPPLQHVEQRLRLFQVARVEAFSEPPVNRSQQLARLLHLALVAPEACQTHCGADPRLQPRCSTGRSAWRCGNCSIMLLAHSPFVLESDQNRSIIGWP